MRKVHLSLMAATILAAGLSTTANASALENILSDAQYSVEIRPRYEYVDQDGKETAKAPTVRTALGMKANLFEIEGLNGEIQMINVSNFGFNGYFPEATSSYATIMDPSQTRVTQANISYSANDTTVIVGRKMVVLDNARFIGNVGWRQMPQTYDLGAVIYNGIENLSLLGAYVTRVHTVKENGQFDTGSILLHATYKLMPELTLTAYDYMIEDFADHIGVRATGKVDLNGVKVAYEAEYAVQNDPTQEENFSGIKQDADYYKLGVSATVDAFTGGIAYEVLSDAGNGNAPFSTPLATLHAMNGWADVFLQTPNEGLQDLSIKLAYNAGEYGKLIGIYHDFKSDVSNSAGDDDLGSELDLAYKYKINNNLGLLLKYADYSAGDATFNYVDTTKYWVQLDYKFKSE